MMSGSSQSSSTSASLLQRVRRFDPDAWDRLCALYGPVVYGWCRRAGLQENDAAEVLQEVFRSVFRGIGDFQKSASQAGTFRGWLTWLDCSTTGDSDLSPLQGMPLKTINQTEADAFWKQFAARRQTAETFATEAAKLPADQQVAAVVGMLKTHNDGQGGALGRVIENDAVCRRSTANPRRSTSIR
jgi:Sigma-70 region 2